MAATSITSNPVAHSVQAPPDTFLPFGSYHGANSLYLQRLVVRKTLSTPLAPGLGLGLGLRKSSRNVLRQSRGCEMGSHGRAIARALIDQAVATVEDENNPRGAVASVGLDDQSVHEGADAASSEERFLLGSDKRENCRDDGDAGIESNASAYHGRNGVEYRENNGVALQGSNGNGAAYKGGNGSSHRESNDSSNRGNASVESAAYLSKDDTKFMNGSTIEATDKKPSVAATVVDGTSENGPGAGTNRASIRNMPESLGVELQSEKEGRSGTAPHEIHQEQISRTKYKIESIGQEDPWFKQAGAEKLPESVTAGGKWNRFKTYSTIQRTCEIWFFVATFVFKAWLINQKFAYRGGITEGKKKDKRKDLAKWLKEGLLKLGPTFIKIGQQFSTRVDILPQEYVDQLSELQDQVPPFESEISLKIVEDELGAPVGQIFDQFDPDPVAAASLGQVHRAVFRGEEVVVKVQRPGLKDLFDIDLKNLRVIAENLQKLDPKSDGAKRDWVAIYDECASVLYQEIDYGKEGASAERFANNFKDIDYVKVPKIWWECTTPQVLTMEYVPGIKINRTAALDQLGVDRKKLARYAVESYLEQILRHGFFHADPHPGNIAVDDENGGRLIFYDFGMMGSISPNIREGLLEAFYGIYEKDPDKVLQAMVQMGVLVPTGDKTAVRRTAQFFLTSFEDRLAAQRAEREAATTELGFKKPLSKEAKVEKKNLRLAAIGEDLLSISVDQPFRFPATFTFVVRAFSVLDGIGKGLDPRFDISEIAKPYALEILRFRQVGYDVFIRDLKKRWNRQAEAFANLFRQADRVEKLAEVIQRIEQGDLKLRVRTLESERAFKRVATVQQTIGQAILAGTLLNLATLLHISAVWIPSMAAFIGSAFFGFKVLVGLLKVNKLDNQEKLITGIA